jgi:saccharopine dehydrogenase-like NADP-dependent oxidoreductase
MRITVLGGAGKMGCISVQGLAGDDRVDEIVLADLDSGHAEIVTTTIKSPKIQIQQVDLTDEGQLDNVLQGSDVCLNATTYYTNLLVMEASLRNGVHYTDMGGLFHGTRKQLELHDRYKEAGVSAVLCMGSAPGIPNIQARYAADRLDTIESILIFDGVKPPPPEDLRFSYAVPTILDEITMPPMVFVDGKFEEREPLSEFEDYAFTPPLGILPMHLTLHSEVATLPISFKNKGIKECKFKIDYWGMSGETIEKLRILQEFGFNSDEPVEAKGVHVIPREFMGAVLAKHVYSIEDMLAPPTHSPPDWTKEIVTEIRGTKDGEPILYRLGTLTCKGALPTGIAPAIAAIWLAEGKVDPGVYPPELAIDPEPFFKELEAYDIPTQVSVTSMV